MSDPAKSGSISPVFKYVALPTHVVFGHGTVALARAEMDRLGRRRALVLTTRQQEAEGRQLSEILGDYFVASFCDATMHTPTEVTELAMSLMKACKADCLVSVGGGSTIGLSKALALRSGIDQICVPTTYAGSEMTPLLGETNGTTKTTLRSAEVLPEVVIYDVQLTMRLPASVSAASGMNAIAHAAEALYARNGNPIVSIIAEEAIGGLATALPLVVADISNVDARATALKSAWLAGMCLGSVGMSIHHKLCHVLGGSFGLPHAETHAILLPHSIAYHMEAAPEAMSRISRALGGKHPAQGLFDLLTHLGLPAALSQIGLKAENIDQAAKLALDKPYWNPRPVEYDGVRDLIAQAYAGLSPLQQANR